MAPNCGDCWSHGREDAGSIPSKLRQFCSPHICLCLSEVTLKAGGPFYLVSMPGRALCRIKLLPVTHVLVDTWMLTVKLVYELSDVSDDLKWATNTYDTIYTHFQGITNNIYGWFWKTFFLLLRVFTRPPISLPVHSRFYPS